MARFTTQVRNINTDWKIRCFQCCPMHTNQHPATLIKQLMPSVLSVSSPTVILAGTASSAWVRTDFGRGRTVVTLLWKSSLCPSAWWEGHVPCGPTAGNCLEPNRGAPGHSVFHCSASACLPMGTLPACSARAQARAWTRAWTRAVRDQPLPAVPARSRCSMPKHPGWEQGDQNQTLRNGRPKNASIWTERTYAL